MPAESRWTKGCQLLDRGRLPHAWTLNRIVGPSTKRISQSAVQRRCSSDLVFDSPLSNRETFHTAEQHWPTDSFLLPIVPVQFFLHGNALSLGFYSGAAIVHAGENFERSQACACMLCGIFRLNLRKFSPSFRQFIPTVPLFAALGAVDIEALLRNGYKCRATASDTLEP